MALKAQDDCKSDWASLPRELLHNVLAAAAFTPADATRATAANNKRHLPSLADAARLRYAVEASCRSWRASAADFPLRVTLGTSPLPPNATPALLEFLCRRPLAALQFASSGLAGCRPGAVQQLAIDLLASDALAAAAGSCLLEVSVFDYICSRPLCALLPRFPALRCVALSGYSIDIGTCTLGWYSGPTGCVVSACPALLSLLPICEEPSHPPNSYTPSAAAALFALPACLPADLEPLQKLPRLESLHIEAEGLPRLDGLPASLRHLSLTCFANAARFVPSSKEYQGWPSSKVVGEARPAASPIP